MSSMNCSAGALRAYVQAGRIGAVAVYDAGRLVSLPLASLGAMRCVPKELPGL
jgi:hypothetical protein